MFNCVPVVMIRIKMITVVMITIVMIMVIGHVGHDNSHVDDGHSGYSRDGDDDSMKGRSSRIWHRPSLQPQSIPII